MSKAKLKKYLQSLSQEQLVQVVLDLYSARKEAKEYLEFFMDPNEEDALERYKKTLKNNYFTTQGRPRAKLNVKLGNDIVADFVRLDVAPEKVADLMIFHVEVMMSRIVVRRIIRETAWNSAVTMFRKAVDYINAHNLIKDFERRINRIIEYSHNAPSYLRVPHRLSQELEESSNTP